MGRTIADVRAGLQRSEHVLTIANSRDYAPHLQDRRAYYVIDGEHAAQLVRKNLKAATSGGVPVSDRLIALSLEAAGQEEVSHQRSLTNELRPAVPLSRSERARGASTSGRQRRAHPGHWADITTNLSNSYKAYVNGSLKVPEKS